MPSLSVILPVRNGAPTIEVAVTSTLGAMPADAELVVLDDASTDDTGAILDRLTDPRLRVIHRTDGLGVAGGLNHLLANTDSEFVGRMDADDRCLPGRFHRQLRALRAGGGADVVFTSVIPWRRGRRVQRPDAPIGIGTAAFPLHLLVTNPASHPAMAARRDALDAVGGYRDVPSEDYDLWLRLAATGHSSRRLPLWGLLYAIHDSQITASGEWRARSWADPLVAAAYDDLHRAVLGRPGRRLVTIATDDALDTVGRRSEFEAFAADLEVAAAHLGPLARRFLLDKARRRWRSLELLQAAHTTA